MPSHGTLRQPVPTSEARRLAVLAEYELLDSPPDEEVKALVRVAAAVAAVPNAALNLIDANFQCQLATHGFEGRLSPREDSMCAAHFEDGAFVWVPDASLDPRFAASPWVVGDLGDVRFYASGPLISPDGEALGTLCVFDDQPHRLSDDQAARLQDLALALVAVFERRRQSRLSVRLAVDADSQRAKAEAAMARLRSNSQRLAAIIASANDAFLGISKQGLVVEWNAAAEVMFGYRAVEALGRPLFELIFPPDQRSRHELALSAVASGEDARIFGRRAEVDACHRDGRCFPIELNIWQADDAAESGELYAFVRDISDRRTAEAERERHEARQSAVLEAQAAVANTELTPSKIMAKICQYAQGLVGGDGSGFGAREGDEIHVRYARGSSAAMAGVRLALAESLSGRAVIEGRTLSTGDLHGDVDHDCVQCREVGVASMICVPLRHAGDIVGVLTVVSRRPQKFDARDEALLEGLAAPFGSALANAWRMQLTSEQAMTDELTGLANRNVALRELERALARRNRVGGEVAAMFIDLDGFKAVNDTYGHVAGDALLAQVADRLREAVRSTDTPARFGGDEFVVICENLADAHAAGQLGERLRARLGQKYLLDCLPGGLPVRVGASVGIAVTRRATAPADLLEAADAAMYEAKRAGGDGVRLRELG